MKFKLRPGDTVITTWSNEELKIIRRVYSLKYPAYLCRFEGVFPEEDLILVHRPDKVSL